MSTSDPVRALFTRELFAWLESHRRVFERLTISGHLAVACYRAQAGAAEMVRFLGGAAVQFALTAKTVEDPGFDHQVMFRMTRAARKTFQAVMRHSHDPVTAGWLKRKDRGGDFRVFVLHGDHSSFLVNYRDRAWSYEPGSLDRDERHGRN